MENAFITDVYNTLRGHLLPDHQIPGVENVFTPGKRCDLLYSKVYDAQRRLEQRLGVQEYDSDVETIIESLTQIQKELCYCMYQYGAKFGMRE
jgi:hypothetical protein